MKGKAVRFAQAVRGEEVGGMKGARSAVRGNEEVEVVVEEKMYVPKYSLQSQM